MSTSKSIRRPAATVEKRALDLAWGAWTELGVSGWGSTHRQWAIDPEPLILFTSFLGDRDPRLRDEATDWCIRNWRYVSKARLKNLLRRQPTDEQVRFGEFAATVGNHAGISWPGATSARDFRVTGKSSLPPLERPSLAWIRLRVMFGLGARSEVLRFFLSGDGTRASAALIARASGYLKRTVSEECEAQERAGVLSARSVGNRFYYSLARSAELHAFVGELPELRPDWTPIFNIARKLVLAQESIDGAPARTTSVKAKAALRSMQDELDDLEIEAPSSDLRGDELWAALNNLGDETLGAWSTGRWGLVSS